MILKGVDGKIQHLKELAFIEQMLFNEVTAPADYYKALEKYLTDNYDLAEISFWKKADLEKIDSFTYSFFAGKIDESKTWLLRAYVVGRYLAQTDVAGSAFIIPSVKQLPASIEAAMKKYGLTVQEAEALQAAVDSAAMNMTNTTQDTMDKVKEAIVEETKTRGDARGVLKQLEELLLKKTNDAGELGRDWQRVIVTEISAVFNDGYLSSLNEGTLVTIITMPDCCNYCGTELRGQVFRVRKTAAPDYSNMRGAEREKWEDIWETEVWAGKRNIGRSTSLRKRINPLIGNKEDNLREKEHHEFSMPALPAHPSCRCKYMRLTAQFQYIDKNGILRLRVEDEDEWREWYDEYAKPLIQRNIKNPK